MGGAASAATVCGFWLLRLTLELALRKMPFHHVIAKVAPADKFQCLFADLSAAQLCQRFIMPFERGKSFFAGNDLISPADLRSIHIVRTERADQVERNEINRSSEQAFILSLRRGYEPEDILEAGEDVTHTFIKGPPGHRTGVKAMPIKVTGWIGGIVATVIAAGIVKWLGWI